MTIRLPRHPAWPALMLGVLLGCLSGCRSPEEEGNAAAVLPPIEDLSANQLGRLDGPLYDSCRDSPIHWQAYAPQLFERARQRKQMVFCVLARPDDPASVAVLRALEATPQIVGLINSSYVPTLIDIEVLREFELLGAGLVNSERRQVAFPMLLWLDFNHHTVACTPVKEVSPAGVARTFNQSHYMITPLWMEDMKSWDEAEGDPGYVLVNSARTHEQWKARLEHYLQRRRFSEDPGADLLTALRGLFAGYDSFSHTFAGSGGEFPSATIELLAVASRNPEIPDGLRGRCREVLDELLEVLLASAMFDPLDGGVFASRMGPDWELPVFSKNGASQARVAAALMQAYRSTRNPRVLDHAVRLLAHLEADYRTRDGLFMLQSMIDADPAKWMWTTQEVEEVLGAQDAGWWIRLAGMKNMGNLPLEFDPKRQWFRKNVIKPVLSMELADEALTARFDAVRSRLRAARDQRMDPKLAGMPHLATSFQMVSTYMQAHQATGKRVYLDQAASLLHVAIPAFTDDGRLRASSSAGPEWLAAARAYHHALAIRAALEVERVAPEGSRMAWILQMIDLMADQFADGAALRECPRTIGMTDLPLTDQSMRFGESSTQALLAEVVTEMRAMGRIVPGSLRGVAGRLPLEAVRRPVLHVDLLKVTLNSSYPASE